jgi:hypothetical protein
MRSDMGRVVIERPRYGSSQRSPKIRHFRGQVDRHGDYDGPVRLPSSRGKIEGFAATIEGKNFTDRLGPLRRYLQKNVGRPWDKIYGEARAALTTGGWGVEHVFHAHFLREVDRDVFRDTDGQLISRRYGVDRKVAGFYVDPRTGLLCYSRRRTK